MNYEKLILNEQRNVTLTCYRLDSSEEMQTARVRPAILSFPGGAYMFCSDREAEPVAMAYLAEGYHAFVLRYSVKEHALWPNPLTDAEQALGLIREHAADWQVDPERIAVIGFSAGGHLAAATGLLAKEKPNAMMLCYPAILTELMQALPESTIPGLEGKVSVTTPPAFLFATSNDEVVPVQNTTVLAQELADKGIPFECHIFADGRHGLSLAKPHTANGFKQFVNPPAADWFQMSITWLAQIFGEYPHENDLPFWDVEAELKKELE
jgi:acetyl esterase/lipase